MLIGEKISPPPENVRVKTYETLNITLNSLSIVLQELLTAYQADLKRARVGGSPSDNKANLTLTRLKLDLTTGTELGNFTKKEVQFWPFIILAHIVSIALQHFAREASMSMLIKLS